MIWLVLILGIACVGLGVVVQFQWTKTKQYSSELESLRDTNKENRDRIHELEKKIIDLTGKLNQAEEAANARKAELNKTADSELAARANNLFSTAGGVQDKPKAKRSRAKPKPADDSPAVSASDGASGV